MEPYVGEIRCFAFGRIPTGWVACSGQTLTVNQNQALYALIGNIFGGTSPTTFGLPNLNGVVPIHYGQVAVGASGGSETVTLDPKLSNIPAHTHIVSANTAAADQKAPTGNYLGAPPSTHLAYASAANLIAMDPANIQSAGSGAPHPNMQPYLPLNYCIATTGYFPPRP